MRRLPRISVRGVAPLLVLCLLVAAISIILTTQEASRRHRRAQERADLAIENTTLYQQALSAAYDEWIVVMSYFVTHDDTYLVRFSESRSTFEASMSQVRDNMADPVQAQKIDGYIETHDRFADVEAQVLEKIRDDDLFAAVGIASDRSLTVDSAQLLSDLRDEIRAQQDELRAAEREQHDAVTATTRWSMAGAAVSLALLAAISFAAYFWIGRSLLRASAATRAIASGDLSERVQPSGPRELADLAGDVNTMAESLIRRSEELNAYLAQDLETRTRELEQSNSDLAREVQEHRHTSEFLRRTLETQRDLEQQLRHQAFHDPLTGIANRARFMDRLEHAVELAARDDQQIGVIFMDIDDFKAVNDSLGHSAGDRLLQELAGRVIGAVRPGDTAARIGGDEFAVLMEEVGEPDAAREVAEAILNALRSPVDLGGQEVFVRASLGLALGSKAEKPEEIVRRADVAMYAAKDRGKGSLAVYQPSMEESLEGRLALAGELQRAIERNEFVLHYQPSIDLRRENIAGVEALVRWDHPTRGLLPPAEFITLAERTGLILPLGRWVLREACRQARQWQLAYPHEPPLSVAVNISPAQVHHDGLTETVAEALEYSGLPPESLILEITESVMMQDAERAMERLAELRALGLRLAIDDFGTGYSSLSYLRRFPVNILKIDKSFVDALGERGREQEIAQSIIRLGQTLKLEVVAEGVEQVEQVGWLRAKHCDFVQGFYFSRPLPADELSLYLQRPSLGRSA